MKHPVPTSHGTSRLLLAPLLLNSISALVLGTLSLSSQSAELLAQAPAGAVPNIDQLRPTVPMSKEGLEASLPEQAQPEKEMGKPQDDIKVNVKRFVLDPGAPAALQNDLDTLTAPFTGPDRSYEDLMNAVSAVTRYLQRDLDLYLGYAYLPAQQPNDGEIKIAVLEGRLDQVILNWSDDIPIDKAVVEAHLARLQPGSVLHVKDVERVVFLLNDLRGLTARFEIKQGRVVGTSSLVVTPTSEKRVSGRTEFDANGSRFSGIYRAGVTANIASPLNKGDSMVLSTQITNGGGLLFLLGGYTLPVGSNGLKAGLSVSKVQYHLTSEVPLHLKGDATAVSAYALYPVVRSRNLNMFAQTSAEQRDFIDRKGDLGDTANSTKRAYELRFGLAGDFRDNWLLGGVSTYDLAASASQVIYLKNGPALSLLDAKNRGRLNLGFSRLNNLLSNRLLAYISVSTQKAWRNLDTTEQFSIGGPGRVRAFAPGEGTGDEGQVGTVELRWLPTESLMGRYARETVFSAFYDWGHVRYKHDASNQALGFVSDAVFSGYGVGATWERPQVLGARLSVAWPKQGEAQNDTVARVPRVYATVMAPF